MRALLLVLALAFPAQLTGEPSAKGWTLSGWLLAAGSHAEGGTHRPIAGQEILLRRLSHPFWCVFCLGGYVDYATTTTSEKGEFKFAGTRRAWYELAIRCPPGSQLEFGLRDSVDRLERGEYHTYIEYSSKPCEVTIGR